MAERNRNTKEQRAGMQNMKCLRFTHNARVLFMKAADLVKQSHNKSDRDRASRLKHTLEKMLHSILFMGHLHASVCTPAQIFLFHFLKTREKFPKAFESYRTHVPLKTPFSYFLELVMLIHGENNETKVKETLSETLAVCEKSGDTYPLISAVMCICESGVSRYYGASLSCIDYTVRHIMTAVSCVKVWHPNVSSVVASVFPGPAGTPRSIQLPASVQCTAYAVENMKEKAPCMTCVQLYSLKPHSDSTTGNAAGNCAETEAISNLLHQGKCRVPLIGAEIKGKMEAHFKQKIEEKMRSRAEGNRSSYSIDVVFDT